MKSFFGKLAMIDEKKLTHREKQIVKYIRDNLQAIVSNEMKIERLAQEAGTGYSAIYGLLQKIGIHGYRDFILALTTDAENAKMDIANNDELVAEDLIQLIRQNHSVIDKKNINKTLTLIRKSRRIFISYWENELMNPAEELESFLVGQNADVYLVNNDSQTIQNRADHARNGDLFIFYSMVSNGEKLQKIMATIKDKGANIILISARIAATPISRLSDSIHTLITTYGDPKKKNATYLSKNIPFLYFNDLLIYHFVNTKDEHGY
ncbi:MurR/RpiR family transcriptional regulator [Mesoplasma lactucae]|uniref:Uncharacterized protein n=1 Tax=Mesoplasma lactucae ATCC 49193 TaxID=81460 RepID=A0A291ISE7_9MOLU|nr:MurR/RpiR family transcriptional regulator [Mesoplasma lactucae]ATG97621.1 hypothetical protein CP520_02660 [Mesoplasma lactucae ATCC 49193]ATZ19918.1 hypothetical protein MLACT_v1c00940 [Mesoplasma lactucae ATCC 49193]MCL8216782.1 hypothetical protein [Mesoplasma lactucae ATCC 49193]